MISFKIKIKELPKVPFMIVISISLYALLILYSIGAGSFYPWCIKQFIRLIIGSIFLLIGASSSLNFWKRHAYSIYLLCFIMLILVAIAGKISMGAQRWLNFYFFNFQPSELMRIALVIVMARFFSERSLMDIKKSSTLLFPIALIAAPVGLVLLQPDLGTAMLLVLVGLSIFFVNGVQIWKFFVCFGSVAAMTPILWSMLHEYQKKRILMFISPEMDPSGAGYHIIQSQIAIGSGGFWGRGLMNGTQSQLNFLPEKQTDFVFAALAEELGFFGCMLLLVLYGLLLAYNINVIFKTKSKFNQILVFGLNAMLFFYIFINISMVCGLLPVVGIPLPYFSYGGSALVVLMFCQGLIFAVDIEQSSKSGLKYSHYNSVA